MTECYMSYLLPFDAVFNWRATWVEHRCHTVLISDWPQIILCSPYHAPVFLAQSKGYFAEEGIKVALITPQDPSDVTEIIGTGKVSRETRRNFVVDPLVIEDASYQVDMGAKAMIHTIAGKARGFPIKSIGTMMDEPFTGLVYLKESGIKQFQDIKGRKIGYVGEFGKVQVCLLPW